jgi:two-component system chemotaxis response regulator CheY
VTMQHLALTEVTIILVNPSDTQRKTISKQLVDVGIYQVEAVSNVKQAVQAMTR